MEQKILTMDNSMREWIDDSLQRGYTPSQIYNRVLESSVEKSTLDSILIYLKEKEKPKTRWYAIPPAVSSILLFLVICLFFAWIVLFFLQMMIGYIPSFFEKAAIQSPVFLLYFWQIFLFVGILLLISLLLLSLKMYSFPFRRKPFLIFISLFILLNSIAITLPLFIIFLLLELLLVFLFQKRVFTFVPLPKPTFINTVAGLLGISFLIFHVFFSFQMVSGIDEYYSSSAMDVAPFSSFLITETSSQLPVTSKLTDMFSQVESRYEDQRARFIKDDFLSTVTGYLKGDYHLAYIASILFFLERNQIESFEMSSAQFLFFEESWIRYHESTGKPFYDYTTSLQDHYSYQKTITRRLIDAYSYLEKEDFLRKEPAITFNNSLVTVHGIDELITPLLLSHYLTKEPVPSLSDTLLENLSLEEKMISLKFFQLYLIDRIDNHILEDLMFLRYSEPDLEERIPQHPFFTSLNISRYQDTYYPFETAMKAKLIRMSDFQGFCRGPGSLSTFDILTECDISTVAPRSLNTSSNRVD
jgi:hypothetical protein